MAILDYMLSVADFDHRENLVYRSSGNTSTYLAPYASEYILTDDIRNDYTYASGIQRPLSYSGSEVWFSGYFALTNSFRIGNNTRHMKVYSDTGDLIFMIWSANTASNQELRMRVYDGAGGYHDIITAYGENTSTLRRLDIRFFFDSVNGAVEVYKDGVSFGTPYSGDLTNSGAWTGVGYWGLSCVYNDGGDHSYTYWSSVFWADEDSRDIECVQIHPGAAGSNSDLTGSYADVDGIGYDEGSSIYAASGTAGDASSFDLATVTTDFDTGYDVIAVGVSVTGKKGTAASKDVDILIRSGTTEDTFSADALELGLVTRQNLWHTNPDTAAAWTISEAKAVEIGVKLK